MDAAKNTPPPPYTDSPNTTMISSPNQSFTHSKRNYDVIIVGAGILGCALAATMGKQGRDVLLLERDLSEPNRIVGELLQPGGVSALEILGLRDCLEGIDAVPVHGYQCVYHGAQVNIPYAVGESGKRPQGRSFHHGRFIQKLRAAARAAPNVTIVEAAVSKNLIKSSYPGHVVGVRCTPKNEKHETSYFAPLTVAADGCRSNLRSDYITKQAEVRSHFFGLELIDTKLPEQYHGTVILSDIAPVLLYQIGTHETRALVDIQGRPPSQTNGELKNYLLNTVVPVLPESVKPSFKKAVEDSSSVRSMPNSWLPPTVNKTPGLLFVGDSMNMRHPLTGGGMTVAFNDVVLMKDLLSVDRVPDLSDTELVLEQMEKFHWRRKNLTSIINIMAQALYALFAANERSLRVLQKGCFEYFRMGGNCVDGPVGLLSGITRQPMVLFYHFFAVAFFSIYIMFAQASPSEYLACFFLSFAVFYKACVVLFPYIWSEVQR